MHKSTDEKTSIGSMSIRVTMNSLWENCLDSYSMTSTSPNKYLTTVDFRLNGLTDQNVRLNGMTIRCIAIWISQNKFRLLPDCLLSSPVRATVKVTPYQYLMFFWLVLPFTHPWGTKAENIARFFFELRAIKFLLTKNRLIQVGQKKPFSFNKTYLFIPCQGWDEELGFQVKI